MKEIQAVEDIANKADFKEKIPSAYSNNDEVSCYANSVCQWIFSFGEVILNINLESSVCKTLKIVSLKHIEGNSKRTLSQQSPTNCKIFNSISEQK